VLVDHELTPSQARNLERATGAEVLDRTAVILAIFQRHAKSREARLQVEIARLNYIAPRLREMGGGRDREGGGIGGRGAGESASELDRRKVRDRIAELRAELAAIEREAGVRRKRRAEQNTVALVGYTNAGKSSWMRALTGSDVLVQDKLFATLGTTVRALVSPGATARARLGHGRLHQAPAARPRGELPLDARRGARERPARARGRRVGSRARGADRGDARGARADRRAGDPALDRDEQGSTDRRRARARVAAAHPDARLLSAKRAEDVAALRDALLAWFERDLEAGELVCPTRSRAWSPRRTSADTCSRRPTAPTARGSSCARRARCSRACAPRCTADPPASAQAPPPDLPKQPELCCCGGGA
jgi:GTP-binding protein HflX